MLTLCEQEENVEREITFSEICSVDPICLSLNDPIFDLNVRMKYLYLGEEEEEKRFINSLVFHMGKAFQTKHTSITARYGIAVQMKFHPFFQLDFFSFPLEY